MKNWLRNLFAPPTKTVAIELPATPQPAAGEDLRQKTELQSLRINQAGDRRTIEHLTQVIERLREQQEELVELSLANRLETLFKDMAAPASQILTQAHLVEDQGKTVQAQDILAVSRRMLRAMERNGVVFEGKVGETVSFDPERQISIQPEQKIEAGKAVVVRFSGVSYRGKMIYQAIVEQEPECRDD